MKNNKNKNKSSNKILYLFITLLCSLSLFMLLFFVIDSDYLWHIKAGDYMFHHGVLKKDVFSWFVKGKYWMSHEWLFEIIIYTLKNCFGKLHLYIYCFVTIFSLLLMMFIPNYKNKLNNIRYFLVYLMFFILLFVGFMNARPHLISFVLFAYTIYSLYDLYLNEESKKIYFLPIISIIWSNVHGGSSNLVYLLCFIFYIVGHFQFKLKKIEADKLSKKQLKKYLLIMFICMICTCINIHGLKMLIYPYENMLDSRMLSNIAEWQPTTLTRLYNYVYYIFILFILGTMILSSKKIRLLDFIIFIFFTYLGIKSVRFWTFIYISMSYIIFYYVKSRDSDNNIDIYFIFIIVIMFMTFMFNYSTNYSYYYNLDSEVIKEIKKVKPKRLYNMYDYGGELVYHGIDVFIDGRADLYGKHNYQDYLDISCLSYNTDRLLTKYKFDYLLVSKDYPIYMYLDNNEDYKQVFKKNNIVLYKKK